VSVTKAFPRHWVSPHNAIMWRSSRFTGGIALSLLACGDTQISSPAAALRRDSAGIEIVDNPEHAPDTLQWSLDTVPRVAIGDESRGNAYTFAMIVAVERFSDGRIIVAEGHRSALGIRVFDSLGIHLHDLGRRGQGPGEYASIRDLYVLPGDTLVAASIYDTGPLIYYDGHGSHARTVLRTDFPPDSALGQYRIVSVLGAFDDGALLAMLGWQPGWASAAMRTREVGVPHFFADTAKLIRGHPMTAPLAVYGVVPRERGVFYPRGMRVSGFHDLYIYAQPSFAIRGMHVLVAGGEAFEIREYAPDGGLARIIRKQHTPVPIGRAWADSVVRASRAAFRRYPDLHWILDAPVPEPPAAAPAIDRLVVDDDGNLWVHSNQRGRSPAEPVWYVFDSTGVLRHSLRAPIPQVARIGRDHVLGVVRDSLDVPRVVVLPLIKQ